jgi:hypothetical protein
MTSQTLLGAGASTADWAGVGGISFLTSCGKAQLPDTAWTFQVFTHS